MEKIKRGRGRPQKSPEEKNKVVAVSLPPHLIELVMRLGEDKASKGMQIALEMVLASEKRSRSVKKKGKTHGK